MENLDDEDFGGLDTDPNLGLREKPEYLLNYLRVRQNRVMKSRLQSMSGLPLYMEMSIYSSLIFQLERELARHRSKVSELMDMASKWVNR